ncbi:MAG: hypothetical protein C5617_007050 [ANME-2 cluster archaeon]|jgi:hypothetical protein|nr:MAG: hypothetical protein C5617_007050 [ANME-2 cluster archaeon]
MFDIIIVMVKPIVCAALLLAVLAHPAVSTIEDGSIYEDYVDIGEVQSVEVYQGSSTTFSVSATNHGNLCYGGVILKYPRDLPEGITISPVESQTIDIGETATYEVTIYAGENTSIGTYNIGIADNAANDPNTWRYVGVSVLTPPPPPTPVPTEKVTPVAGGIPTRPAEATMETGGIRLTDNVLFWLVVVLGALLGIGAFMRYRGI